MTANESSPAQEVHALLLSAHPHPGDADLSKAAELASRPDGRRDELRGKTLLAIQTAQTAIAEGASADEAERLLLRAIRAAEQWVRACV